MHGTRTSLRAKTGLSILGFSRDFGISYKRASAMAERDARYQLADLLELDDSYFGTRHPPGQGKRGRGTDKRPVLVAVDLKGSAPAHAKMQVMPCLSLSPPLTAHSRVISDRTDYLQALSSRLSPRSSP